MSAAAAQEGQSSREQIGGRIVHIGEMGCKWNLRGRVMLSKNERLLMVSLRETLKEPRWGRWRTGVWLATSLTAYFWLLAGAGAATFTASLDRDTITLGEGATLSLSVEGGSPDNVPSPPGNPNLQVTRIGTSTQFSISNGQSSSTVIYTFQLTPRQPGDYSIPALSAVIGGEKVTSPPGTLKVLQ